MPDYKKLALELFGAVDEAIALVERSEITLAKRRLEKAKRDAEKRYMEEWQKEIGKV